MNHQPLKKRIIIGAIILITLLMAGNIVLIYRNGVQIEANRRLHEQSEDIKTTVSRIAIDVVHNLDLGTRSFALFKEDKYLYPFNLAQQRKDSILSETEALLSAQGFALDKFYVLRDSINAYADLNITLKQLVDEGKTQEFLLLANQDRGYQLWLQFESFEKDVHAFENGIQRLAMTRYNDARKNNIVLQFILLIISIPTLIFTAIHTFRGFKYQRKLRESETRRADFLKDQNILLEQKVAERTLEIQQKNRALQEHSDEIAAQNEEIRAQNEQLVCQQDQIIRQNQQISENLEKLERAQEVILCQQRKIEIKNAELEVEVERKTNEVVQYNQQLEQFAFTSAHNLRAPVARIQGLSNLLKLIKGDRKEEELIIDNISTASEEVDCVIRDLTTILELKSNVNSSTERIVFTDEMKLIRSNLKNELLQSGCKIIENFEEAPSAVAVKSYVDSILFNLISNAIKYRSPERTPIIKVRTCDRGLYFCIEVADNGLGFDLEKYGGDIFFPYKRFHLHIAGKGLGLHLVKIQAMALGGYVEVDSKVDSGTTFRVFLKKNESGVSVYKS